MLDHTDDEAGSLPLSHDTPDLVGIPLSKPEGAIRPHCDAIGALFRVRPLENSVTTP
jgi:hypothetical protein